MVNLSFVNDSTPKVLPILVFQTVHELQTNTVSARNLPNLILRVFILSLRAAMPVLSSTFSNTRVSLKHAGILKTHSSSLGKSIELT